MHKILGRYIPSHTLYADDVMVFCKGKMSCTQALRQLFLDYANCFGQNINQQFSLVPSQIIY